MRIAIEVFAYVVTIHKIFPNFFDTAVLSCTTQWTPHVFLPGKSSANWQLLSLGLILALNILTLLAECKWSATYCGSCGLSPIALLTTRATCSATQRVTCKKVYIFLLQLATKQKFKYDLSQNTFFYMYLLYLYPQSVMGLSVQVWYCLYNVVGRDLAWWVVFQ